MGYAATLVLIDVTSPTREAQIGAALAGKPVPEIPAPEGSSAPPANASVGVSPLGVYDPAEVGTPSSAAAAASSSSGGGAAAAGGKRKAAGDGAGAGASKKKK